VKIQGQRQGFVRFDGEVVRFGAGVSTFDSAVALLIRAARSRFVFASRSAVSLSISAFTTTVVISAFVSVLEGPGRGLFVTKVDSFSAGRDAGVLGELTGMFDTSPSGRPHRN
jgi:hypothetical protein